jgi:hypothetical protein
LDLAQSAYVGWASAHLLNDADGRGQVSLLRDQRASSGGGASKSAARLVDRRVEGFEGGFLLLAGSTDNLRRCLGLGTEVVEVADSVTDVDADRAEEGEDLAAATTA